MRRPIRWPLFAGFFLFIAIVVAVSWPDAGSVRQGETAPDFALPSLAGDVVRLSDLRGEVVLLRFSTRSCYYCADDFDRLEQLQAALGDRGRVLAIEIGDTEQAVRQALGQRAPGYAVLLDRDGEVAARYQVEGVPALVVIDRDGRLRARFRGELDEYGAQLTSVLEPLLR